MDSLKHLLGGAVGRAGIGRQLEAASVVKHADAVLRATFGDHPKPLVRPLSFKNGTLTVSCISSVVAQEIKLKQKEILAQLNDELGVMAVKSIRYLL